jgi:hypothetical protein
MHFASRRESIGSRHAELTFNVCALLAQAIDAFMGHNLPRRSVVVTRWQGFRTVVPIALSKRVLPCTRLASGRLRTHLQLRCRGRAQMARAEGDLCERARFNISRSWQQ